MIVTPKHNSRSRRSVRPALRSRGHGRPRGSGENPGWVLGPLASYIGFQLRRAQDVSFHSFARRVGEADLSPGKFALLAVIDVNPGINQTALSQVTGRDKSTLTPALRDLVARGWVRRDRVPGDRRAYALELTPAGKERLRGLMVHAEQHDRELDALVGQRHKPLFLHLLERIGSGLGQRHADGPR